MGNPLVVQWLGLCTFTARGRGSIPRWGAKIPQAVWHGQKIKIKNQNKTKPQKKITMVPGKMKNAVL